jgi:RNA recognition motif-containing protein
LAGINTNRQLRPWLKNIFCDAQEEKHMSTKLYVGNLSFQTEEHDLREYFGQHGTVVSVNIITDRDTGRSRGFGFVEMDSDDAAQAAIKALDGQELEGRQLKVNIAKPRTDDRGGRRDRW